MSAELVITAVIDREVGLSALFPLAVGWISRLSSKYLVLESRRFSGVFAEIEMEVIGKNEGVRAEFEREVVEETEGEEAGGGSDAIRTGDIGD